MVNETAGTGAMGLLLPSFFYLLFQGVEALRVLPRTTLLGICAQIVFQSARPGCRGRRKSLFAGQGSG